MPDKNVALYETPTQYDALVLPGPCERSNAGLDLFARFGDFDGNLLTGSSLNQVCIAAQTPKHVQQ